MRIAESSVMSWKRRPDSAKWPMLRRIAASGSPPPPPPPRKSAPADSTPMISGIRFSLEISSARSIFFITTPVMAPPSTVGSLNISEHSTFDHDADADEHAAADRRVRHIAGQRADLQERGVGVEQQRDALADRQLAPAPQSFDRLRATAGRRLSEQLFHLRDGLEHAVAVLPELIRRGVEPGLNDLHRPTLGVRDTAAPHEVLPDGGYRSPVSQSKEDEWLCSPVSTTSLSSPVTSID